MKIKEIAEMHLAKLSNSSELQLRKRRGEFSNKAPGKLSETGSVSELDEVIWEEFV